METASPPKLKWRRGDGGYLAELPNVGTVRIFKMYDGWKIHLIDGYYANGHTPRLLADAKRLAADPNWLPLLLAGRKAKQEKDHAKHTAEITARVAKIIYDCRLADSHLQPPRGVPWHEWAERKVGCSLADVRKAGTEGLHVELSELCAKWCGGDADKMGDEFQAWYHVQKLA